MASVVSYTMIKGRQQYLQESANISLLFTYRCRGLTYPPIDITASVVIIYFNEECMAISTRISYNVSLLFPYRCRELTYPPIDITASVVIIYFNEEWTAILRTVHSVVNRSPPRMLKEVVLLDDSSTRRKCLPFSFSFLFLFSPS